MNRLQRLILGSGQLPDQIRAELAGDVVLLQEGLVGSVTYRRYRSPNEYAYWRKQAASGAIAVTGNRMVIWAGRCRHIDVPLDHPVRAAIQVAAERPDTICFGYDAGVTDPSRSGRVEVRLRTTDAERIVALLG